MFVDYFSVLQVNSLALSLNSLTVPPVLPILLLTHSFKCCFSSDISIWFFYFYAETFYFSRVSS